MNDSEKLLELLTEIRDNQRLSLQRQEEHLAIAQEQVERSRQQVAESLELQRQALARAKQIGRIALPAIIFCIVLVVYLVARYL